MAIDNKQRVQATHLLANQKRHELIAHSLLAARQQQQQQQPRQQQAQHSPTTATATTSANQAADQHRIVDMAAQTSQQRTSALLNMHGGSIYLDCHQHQPAPAAELGAGANHHYHYTQHQHEQNRRNQARFGALTTDSEHNRNHNHSHAERHSPLSATTTAAMPPPPPPHYHEIPGVVPPFQGRSSGPPPPYDDVVNPNASPPTYNSLFGQSREARKTSNGFVDLLRQLFLVLIGTLGCTMIIGFLLLIPITMIFFGLFYVNDCKAENIPTFLVVGGVVWIVKNVLNCYNQFRKDSSTSNRPPPRRTLISRQSTSQSASNRNSIDQSISTVAPATTHDTQTTTATTNANSTTTTATTTSTTTAASTTSSRSATRESSIDDDAHHIRHPPMIMLTSFKCESILNYFLIVWFLAGCIVVYRIYEPDYYNTSSQNYCNRTVYLYAFWLVTSAFMIIGIAISCLCCLMASSLFTCNNGRRYIGSNRFNV